MQRCCLGCCCDAGGSIADGGAADEGDARLLLVGVLLRRVVVITVKRLLGVGYNGEWGAWLVGGRKDWRTYMWQKEHCR